MVSKLAWIELALCCYDKDGRVKAMKEYTREGDVSVPEQLTSWGRECLVDFHKEIESAQ